MPPIRAGRPAVSNRNRAAAGRRARWWPARRPWSRHGAGRLAGVDGPGGRADAGRVGKGHLIVAAGIGMAVGGCDRGGGEDGLAAAAAAAAVGNALPVRVATFNLRYETPEDRGLRAWPQRLQLVVATIRRLDADVLGVQEGLHGQVADLRASLPDYDFRGVGRDDGERRGEYCGIFWRRERFAPDPDHGGTFWLSDHPHQPGSRTWGNSVVRICTWQRLVHRPSGRGFCFFNTHWDHQHQGSRERAAQLIAARLDARPLPHEPVVLCGDFNATEDNPAVQFLLGRPAVLGGAPAGPWPGALVDTYEAAHGRPADRRTLHLWSGRRNGALKIDHILVSAGAAVRDAEIIDHRRGQLLASDHYPVCADIRFAADG